MTPTAISWAAKPSAVWETFFAFIAAPLDTAARYGGDEFVLVLPETDSPAALRVADRIAERLSTDGDEPPIT